MSSSGNIIKLNIGGTIFQTSKTTLTRFDGFFKTLLETEIPVARDETGAIFIDRNPKHFAKILDYMRDGDVDLPECKLKCKEILKEAQYYLLEGLMEKCKYLVPDDSEISALVERAKEACKPLGFYKRFVPLLIVHYRKEDWNVVFGNMSGEEFAKKHLPKFRISFEKVNRDKYTPKCWGYSVHQDYSNTASDSGKIDVEDYLEEVEKVIEKSIGFSRPTKYSGHIGLDWSRDNGPPRVNLFGSSNGFGGSNGFGSSNLFGSCNKFGGSN